LKIIGVFMPTYFDFISLEQKNMQSDTKVFIVLDKKTGKYFIRAVSEGIEALHADPIIPDIKVCWVVPVNVLIDNNNEERYPVTIAGEDCLANHSNDNYFAKSQKCS